MKKIFFASFIFSMLFQFFPQTGYAQNIKLNSVSPIMSFPYHRHFLRSHVSSGNLLIKIERFRYHRHSLRSLKNYRNDTKLTFFVQTIRKLQPEKFQLQKITFTVTDSWFSRDKAHHFLTSAFLTTAGYYYSRERNNFSNFKSQQNSICFSLSLGLIKEFRDGMQKHNSFSWKDLVADILGTAVGLVVVSG